MTCLSIGGTMQGGGHHFQAKKRGIEVTWVFSFVFARKKRSGGASFCCCLEQHLFINLLFNVLSFFFFPHSGFLLYLMASGIHYRSAPIMFHGIREMPLGYIEGCGGVCVCCMWGRVHTYVYVCACTCARSRDVRPVTRSSECSTQYQKVQLPQSELSVHTQEIMDLLVCFQSITSWARKWVVTSKIWTQASICVYS